MCNNVTESSLRKRGLVVLTTAAVVRLQARCSVMLARRGRGLPPWRSALRTTSARLERPSRRLIPARSCLPTALQPPVTTSATTLEAPFPFAFPSMHSLKRVRGRLWSERRSASCL